MSGEVVHRLVEPGLVATSLADECTRVVRHDQLRHAAVERQRAGHCAEPGAHALVGGGAGEGIARCAHGGDEDLRARTVSQLEGRSSVVDEELLAGASLLPHRALERLGERLVVTAELGVGPGPLAFVGSAVLGPQQHQRDALAAQFDVHSWVVGFDHATERGTAAQQPALEHRLVEIDRRDPVESGRTRQAEVLGNGALGDRQALRNALVGEPALQLESEYVLDHAYVHALLRHRSRPSKGARLCPAVGSYATSAPTADPVRHRSSNPRRPGGHVTEMTGHVPETAGHDAEITGHALPKYPHAVLLLCSHQNQVCGEGVTCTDSKRDARASRRGIWADAQPVWPWEGRRTAAPLRMNHTREN